ncbi:MAG: serine/threonine-protein kinase [Polyangia bacterium]
MQKRSDDNSVSQMPERPVPEGPMSNRRPTLLGRPVHRSTSETPLPQPEPAREDLGPLVGRTFGGYEIVSYIGEGPSGAVYRGEDLLGNAMAVKVLHPGLANRPRTEQLRRELERLSALDHGQLQHIYDAGYGEEGQFFYVTDELIGCDLETGLDDAGGLPPRKSYEIVRAVCQALEAAHAAGVVHGGLRPRNVFLMPQDHGTAVKLLDFGAARLGGGSDRGIVAGHPVYLAPEQMSGPMDGAATSRSDLYSLGVLMHELFCGVIPSFRGGQASALAGRRGPVVAPPGIDAQLSRLIVSLLDMEPTRRLPSATAVLSELDRWAKNAGGKLDPHQPVVARSRGQTTATGSVGADSTVRMSKFDALALAQETMPSASGRGEDDNLATGPNVLQDEVSRDDDEGVELASEPTSTNASIPELAPRGRKTMTQNSNPKPDSPPARDANASESVEASLEDFISQANASFPAADGWDLHTGDVELIEADDGPDLVAPRPSARRVPERTEVVSQPLPAPMYAPTYAAPPQAAAGTNPLMVAGLTVVAVTVGAVLAFYFLRSMAPQQQPAPQVIIAPAPIAAPVAAAPVVTPIPSPAAPVVTPIPAAAVAAPVAAPPEAAVTIHHAAVAPKKHVAAAPKAAAPKAATPKAASAPKSDAPKKDGGKKSSDWVDPFAN